jgi:hypothetical protein
MRNEEASQHTPLPVNCVQKCLAPGLAPALPEPLRRLSPWPLIAMIPGPRLSVNRVAGPDRRCYPERSGPGAAGGDGDDDGANGRSRCSWRTCLLSTGTRRSFAGRWGEPNCHLVHQTGQVDGGLLPVRRLGQQGHTRWPCTGAAPDHGVRPRCRRSSPGR